MRDHIPGLNAVVAESIREIGPVNFPTLVSDVLAKLVARSVMQLIDEGRVVHVNGNYISLV